ncbi:MAG: NUDIX domain-containing protein [Candidatus Yanofskybacteria bacterium]|nr:NUDIX domain-containing protein [Candidatus Yanofskybacteria bacterium]
MTRRAPTHRKPHTTQVGIDVVLFSIIDDALCVLLINRQWEPYAHVASLPGAFLRADETTQAAAQHVLRTKAGITRPVYMEQLYTFDTRGRDPRGDFPTVAYMTLVPHTAVPLGNSATTQEPHWVPVVRLPRLAFDHELIVRTAVARLRAKLEYTNIVYSLIPATFTLTRLQRVYEIILGHALDKRNFRKKYLSLGLIRATRGMERGGKQRPARLYRFVSRTPAQLKKFF